MVQYGAAYFPFPKRLQTLPRDLKNLGCVVKVKICQELRFTAFGRQPTTRLYRHRGPADEFFVLYESLYDHKLLKEFGGLSD